MSQNATPLDQETLAKNRTHYGDEPHYFWVSFSTEEEPHLLDANQVWQAAREGRRPTHFRYEPLMASERRMLPFIASLEGGADR